MSDPTEQELAQARAEGASREMALKSAAEQGADEARYIQRERDSLINRLQLLDKRYQQKLIHPGSENAECYAKQASDRVEPLGVGQTGRIGR